MANSEAVEVVRQMLERFDEVNRIAPLGDFFNDDVEISGLRAALEGTVYRGPGALEAFDEDVMDSWAALVIRDRSYEDCGDGIVLVHGTLCLTGKETGIELDQRCAFAVVVREGRVSRFSTYRDEAEARASFEMP